MPDLYLRTQCNWFVYLAFVHFMYTRINRDCLCVDIHIQWCLYTYIYLCIYIFNLISVDGLCCQLQQCLGSMYFMVEGVFLPSRFRWVWSYNKEFRGNISVLVGLWYGGLGKAGEWSILWKESSWHELRMCSGWAALVGFKPYVYLVLQWGFEIQIEIRRSCSILSSLKAGRWQKLPHWKSLNLCKLPHWNIWVSAQILKSVLRIRQPTLK